jgi:hypothetical protein
MQRWTVINILARRTRATTYLEIGVRKARVNFKRIEVADKWAVDPVIKTGRCNGENFGMTSDAFFEQLDPSQRFDLVFVDGLHTYKQTTRDIQNSFRHLQRGGLIVCHDVWPHNPAATKPEYVPGRPWCGEVYRAFAEALAMPDVNGYTVDTDNGCGVLYRDPGCPCRQIKRDMTWHDIKADPTLIGLTPRRAFRADNPNLKFNPNKETNEYDRTDENS